MKKLFCWIVALLAMVSLFSGCGDGTGSEDTNGQCFFNAKVLDVSDTEICVECLDTLESDFSVGEKVLFFEDIIAADGVPQLNVGDKIRVVFNENDVTEGDTIQLNVVLAVYKLDDNGNCLQD